MPNSWCLLNFFITFSILLQPFRVFTFSLSNLFFVLVNFDMKISFSYFFSWNWGVGGFVFFWLGGWFLLANFVFEFEAFQEFSNWCWGGIFFVVLLGFLGW